jgi:hypothetical protein
VDRVGKTEQGRLPVWYPWPVWALEGGQHFSFVLVHSKCEFTHSLCSVSLRDGFTSSKMTVLIVDAKEGCSAIHIIISCTHSKIFRDSNVGCNPCIRLYS